MKPLIVTIIGVLIITRWSFSNGFHDPSFPANGAIDTITVTLTEKQRTDLIKSVHGKVKRLEESIKLIASKVLFGNALDEKIKQSVELFLSEKNVVQSLSKDNSGNEISKRRLVRAYFVRLATIPATRVEITFYEVTKLTKFRPGPEPNTYYATALIYQDAKIYYGKDVKVDYYDRSVLQVDIITRINVQRIGDEAREEYVTRLGNIQVRESK
jgi:hypothetical protein